MAIPSDPAVTRSVNEGHPLTEIDGDDPATAAFQHLIDLLSPRPRGVRRSRRLRPALRA